MRRIPPQQSQRDGDCLPGVDADADADANTWKSHFRHCHGCAGLPGSPPAQTIVKSQWEGGARSTRTLSEGIATLVRVLSKQHCNVTFCTSGRAFIEDDRGDWM